MHRQPTLLPHDRKHRDDALGYRAIIDNIAEGIITMDASGTIHSFNQAACHIFGYSAQEAIGNSITMLMPQEMRRRHDAGLRRYVSEGDARIVGGGSVELPGLHKDGHVFQLELAINEVQNSESHTFVGIVRDISERKKAAEELFAEKERLRVTLGSIGEAVITSDEDDRITYMNPVAEAMTGWSSAAALGRLVHDVARIRQADGAAPEGPKRHGVLERRNGESLPVEESSAPLRDPRGAMAGRVRVLHDVSQAQRLAAELSHQAAHDDLTGLINRREFERRLALSLQSGDTEHALLYLDLDQFKVVNDTCGHAAGDELLRQLSQMMAAQLRQSDSLARLGGDEFGIILHACPRSAASNIAETIRRTMADFRFIWDDKAFPASVSIGLTMVRPGSTTLADVLRMADAACYMAKEKGRNRLYVHTMDDAELARHSGQMGWIERIRRALDEGRLLLHAQRVQPLRGGEAQGVRYELLVRMRGADGELVPPAAFIPAAERYGMMVHIDRWVIETAFAGYARHVAESGVPVSYAINLSATSICDEELLPFVLRQFERYGVPPHAICFEITETSAIANLQQAMGLILQLKEIGCRFALDDFGSGMSSFSYLRQLPIDYLKIDGSMVKDLATDPASYAMVEAINHVGHVMGLQTIAEFVETPAIMQALDRIGVDFAQGYAIERPAPL